MIDQLISYNQDELEKNFICKEVEVLEKSKIITNKQAVSIKSNFINSVFSPSMVVRILLFFATLIVLITLLGPIILIAGLKDEGGIRVVAFILGAGALAFNEIVFIKTQNHFRSGITEGLLYGGFLLIALSLLIGSQSTTTILITLIVISITLIFRYLDLLAIILFCGLTAWFIVDIISNTKLAPITPLIVLLFFLGMYHLALSLQKKAPSFIYDDNLILAKSVALLFCYLSVNYFIVRELSIKLLGLYIAEVGDIPLSFLFYGCTLLIPIGYILWGIKTRSLLFIRVGLTVLTLSILTFKYYFSVMAPAVAITLAGALLTALTVSLLYYLKIPKNGFTRNHLINDKWGDTNLQSFIVSQTISANAINQQDNELFGGGKFGGGGAGNSF